MILTLRAWYALLVRSHHLLAARHNPRNLLLMFASGAARALAARAVRTRNTLLHSSQANSIGMTSPTKRHISNGVDSITSTTVTPQMLLLLTLAMSWGGPVLGQTQKQSLDGLGRPSHAAGALQQLPYNHLGLVVDLGVGLWAWPVPWDVDSDGDFDLLVSCPTNHPMACGYSKTKARLKKSFLSLNPASVSARPCTTSRRAMWTAKCASCRQAGVSRLHFERDGQQN